MITRPLEVAAKMRPEPRSLDALFYVNAGLIVLFFSLFGSRFVLAPGLGVTFQVPTMPGALAGGATTTHRISVVRSDLIFVADEGAINTKQLRVWLERKAKETRQPSLLVLVAAGVPTTDFTDIASAAHAAGPDGCAGAALLGPQRTLNPRWICRRKSRWIGQSPWPVRWLPLPRWSSCFAGRRPRPPPR
jgi:hypothetical protein